MKISFLAMVWASGALLSSSAQQAQSRIEPLIESITKHTLRSNRKGDAITWFHPRACRVPKTASHPETILMTLQEIGGSDYFGPVQWSESTDEGKSWSDPKIIPALDRKPVESHPGLMAGVCDVVPQHHPQTDTILALGHVVFYRGPRFSSNDQLARYPVYSVRSADGTWSERRILEWNDPRGSFIYTNNCGQRIVLPNGDILLALSFGAKSEARSVATARCSFDGETLRILEVGPSIEHAHGRGLLEPSLTQFQGKFYLTIRAEDGRGYMSTSEDGLHWSPKEHWAWDDGEALEMSTTQQHWLTHSDGLFLVYTRKDASNEHVIRWRSPLWLARFDPTIRRLIRSSERVALPLIGDGVQEPDQVALMGNFHLTNISPLSSVLTVGEWIPRDGARGDLLMARINWLKPNSALHTSTHTDSTNLDK